jgi:hypothetical protein
MRLLIVFALCFGLLAFVMHQHVRLYAPEYAHIKFVISKNVIAFGLVVAVMIAGLLLIFGIRVPGVAQITQAVAATANSVKETVQDHAPAVAAAAAGITEPVQNALHFFNGALPQAPNGAKAPFGLRNTNVAANGRNARRNNNGAAGNLF